jgi:DNA uptake protein ComE-like DNA-binding protein
MALAGDHKALLFVAAIAVLGAGVRIVGAFGGSSAPAEQPALERQMQASDSARQSSRSRRGNGRARRTPDSTASTDEKAKDSPACLFGKLDLDVATIAQIEALPGIGPATAERIVVDRLAHGPFVSLTGFERVAGITKITRQQIAGLVTFSGALRPINAVPEGVSDRSARPRGSKKTGHLCSK